LFRTSTFVCLHPYPAAIFAVCQPVELLDSYFNE